MFYGQPSTAACRKTIWRRGTARALRRKTGFVKDNFTEVEESNNHLSAVVALWYIPRFTFVLLRFPPLGAEVRKRIGNSILGYGNYFSTYKIFVWFQTFFENYALYN